MSTIDPFGRADTLDHDILESLVVRFETSGRHSLFSKMLHDYLDAMHIDNARSVLDMGCGTGVAGRAIVHRPGFSGRVTGVDHSPHLVAAVERLAREEGISDHTAFRTGNVRSLNFADGAFDTVVAHTLLSHVDDALAVLTEVVRVLKVGGVAGIFDGDYASLTFDHTDPLKGKAYDEALISAVVTNPSIMRQMPRLLRTAGLELVTSFSYVLSEVGTANFWSSAIET